MDIVPASNFTFAELTEAYNQTRVDYLVPMPMNTTRLMEYAHVYDISLEHSAVARQGDLLYGLGMLGVREKRAWITRLGVLPNGRRRGTGSALMERLLSEAKRSAAEYTWLEVIKGNDPAYHLFKNYQFEETRELIVARRPPTPDINQEILERIANITVLDHDEAVALLQNRNGAPLFDHDGHVKQDNGRLKNVHAHDLLDQIVLGDHGIQANHHKGDVDPIIVLGDNHLH